MNAYAQCLVQDFYYDHQTQQHDHEDVRIKY
jgi:hypothetical protein